MDVNRGLPRWFEGAFAAGGLVALSPVFALCALLVRLTSSGPAFFRQQRVGRSGKMFTLYKFRTMVMGQNGDLITARRDRRITRAGRFLRRLKLDELPQVYNVLRGDMSFVGPRPEVIDYVDFTNPLWREVLSARPGITDPVALRLRNEEALLATALNKDKFYREVIQPYKLNGYVEYLRIKSTRNDLRVIRQTLTAIFLPGRISPPPTLSEIQIS